MTLEFLTPGSGPAAPAAQSPMAAATGAAGASFEVRAGWSVPVRFAPAVAEEAALEQTVGWTDVSHLRKTELQGDPAAIAAASGGAALGTAAAIGGCWRCPVTPTRTLIVGEPADEPVDDAVHVLDVTTQFAALRIAGPMARETLARFCALDLRPRVTPPAAFRPGSVARTPGFVLCEAPDQYLVMIGAALGEYFWEVVSDAGTHLGGRPVGVDAPFAAPAQRLEAQSHA